MIKDKKIVVTGGCGFIGSHIVEALWRDNNVIVIDNLSTGKFDNLSSFDIKFHQADLTEPLGNYIKNADYVFHTGANISIEKSCSNSIFDLRNNGLGTLNLLEECAKNSVENFIYSSSSAVYSNNCTRNIVETDEQTPENNYGISKLSAEHYVRLFGRTKKLNTICLRYFNVYGPRQSLDSLYSGVISIFMKRKFNKRELIIYGNGKQTRDFIYVSDIVKANLLAALQADKYSGEVFNVGTGKETVLLNLAKWFKPKEIVFKDKRGFDVLYNSANIDKINKCLGFSPDVTIDQGLSKYLEYMQGQIAKKEIATAILGKGE